MYICEQSFKAFLFLLFLYENYQKLEQSSLTDTNIPEVMNSSTNNFMISNNLLKSVRGYIVPNELLKY